MTTAEILAAIPKLSTLVVGDICLDRWCTYDPSTSEPSRETGIERIGVVRTEVTAGAGGTVANNLAALGCGRVAVLGAIGEDGFGLELARALADRGISDLCVRAAAMQTFTYTKVINGETGIEDRPRLDFIRTVPLDPPVERLIVERLTDNAAAFDAVIVADQAETSRGGVITRAVRDALAGLARAHGGAVYLADSRARIAHFRGAIAKPNRQEGEAACRALFGEVDYLKLRQHLEAPLLMVTHGPDGVLLVEEGGERWVRTRAVENPVDICGAGDSFSAGVSLALAAGATPTEAAEFGNLVASITIMKKGTGTASPAEVREQCRLWQSI
ncbi:MAG TPA: PfkB family carbohydrate kinase [Bryobacteraceae bacterium]|jgi:rfaE bifunctional protein kinase chain/domain|nr:PfkB family carbohydrate kinase [Bryobacteraceae bacterium]